MSFWDTVEMLRKEQNTSYRWLAQKMGIPETTLSSMRHSKTEPRASEAVKIARALDTTVEFLVTEDDRTYFQKYNSLRDALKKILNDC